MNALQEKEFEILKCFIDICEKLELKYYLVCGSALGAVKYNGFIPWDDDIDVGLFRDDYEIFLAKAPDLIPDWMFIQNYRTEEKFPLLMTKLRDSRTTMIEADFAGLDINHGVCIDVFPLDGYPKGDKEIASFERKKKYFLRRQFVRMMGKRGRFFRNFRSTLIWILYTCFGYCKDARKLMTRYDAFLSSYPLDKSNIVCNHGNWQGKLEYASYAQYGDGTMMKFEGIEVRVPAEYDVYLRQKYGEYTQDPPAEEQKSHHNYAAVDVNVPYEVYLNKSLK